MQDSYQPTEVCKGLWIVPDWCEPTEPSALNVRMAPGLAFGTGEPPLHYRMLLVASALYLASGKGSVSWACLLFNGNELPTL